MLNKKYPEHRMNNGIMRGLNRSSRNLTTTNDISKARSRSIFHSPMMTGGIYRLRNGAKGKMVSRLVISSSTCCDVL